METAKKGYHAFRRLTRKPADHWLGYTVAISGALMQMMTYGIDNSFSMFSQSMQEDPTLGFPSATTVSFGNSVSLGLSPVFGVLAGFLVDRLPPRLMMFISTALLFLGLWLCSSFATSSAAVTGSYCLLASISSAFMLSPGAAATGSWFRRRAGLAQGINFCGGGVGSAWIPAVLGQWIEPYGWRKTFRLMSGFCAFGLLACVFSCRRHEPLPAFAEDDTRDGANAGEEDEDESSNRLERHSDDDGAANALPRGQPAGTVRVVDGAAPNVGRGAEYDPNAVIEAADEPAAGARSNNSNAPSAAASPVKGGAAYPTATVAHNNTSSSSSSSLDNEAGDATAASRPRSQARPADADETAAEFTELETAASTEPETLEQALHTRHLKPLEIVRVLLSVKFLANFFMWAIFGWAFYGMIYVTVPYVSSMGAAGTVYQHEPAISTARASTVFTFWGVFQIIGSILVGALGSFTEDAFAYCACASVGGVVAGFLALCRTYASFAACLSIIGFCTAGMFAIMPALIAQSFHGPNLGFFMGCVFVAGCLGGFSAPPIQAQLQERHHGNYSYGCLFISATFTVPGLICYIFLWPNKRNPALRCCRRRAAALAGKDNDDDQAETPTGAQ